MSEREIEELVCKWSQAFGIKMTGTALSVLVRQIYDGHRREK